MKRRGAGSASNRKRLPPKEDSSSNTPRRGSSRSISPSPPVSVEKENPTTSTTTVKVASKAYPKGNRSSIQESELLSKREMLKKLERAVDDGENLNKGLTNFL